MTAAHLDLVEQSLAAERCGDAARALELHDAVPAFAGGVVTTWCWISWHRSARCCPTGRWARWMGYQAVRCEDPHTDIGTMQRLALKYAVETFHDDQLADCHADGGDPIRVIAWVASESWLFHQLWLHELGGLRRFVDELATGRLAEHADLARSWVGPRSAASASGERARGRLSVHDPAGEARGRRCSTSGPGMPRARRVGPRAPRPQRGRRPADVRCRADRRTGAGGTRGLRRAEPWNVVKEALDEGRLVERAFMRADYELVTDVPSIDLLRIGTARPTSNA